MLTFTILSHTDAAKIVHFTHELQAKYRAGGTAPATLAMAGPKFCEPARKLSARAKINISHQELTISYQRDLALKTPITFKWSNPIAVSNHLGIG